MVAQCWIDGHVSHFSFEDCIGHILFIFNISSTQLIIILGRSVLGLVNCNSRDHTYIVAYNVTCEDGEADVANVKELRHGFER